MTAGAPPKPPEVEKEKTIAEKQAERAAEEQRKKAEENAAEEAEAEQKAEMSEKQQAQAQAGVLGAPGAFLAGIFQRPAQKTLEETKEFGKEMQDKTIRVPTGRFTYKVMSQNEYDVTQSHENTQQAQENLKQKEKQWSDEKTSFEQRMAGKSTPDQRAITREEIARRHGIDLADITGKQPDEIDQIFQDRLGFSRDRLDGYLDHPDTLYSDHERERFLEPHRVELERHRNALQAALDEKYGPLDATVFDENSSRYDRAFFAAKNNKKNIGLRAQMDHVFFGVNGPKNDRYIEFLDHRIDAHTYHRFNYELIMAGMKSQKDRDEIMRLMAKLEKGKILSPGDVLRMNILARRYGLNMEEVRRQYHDLHGRVVDMELRRFRALHPRKYSSSTYQAHLMNKYKGNPHVFLNKSGKPVQIIRLGFGGRGGGPVTQTIRGINTGGIRLGKLRGRAAQIGARATSAAGKVTNIGDILGSAGNWFKVVGILGFIVFCIAFLGIVLLAGNFFQSYSSSQASQGQ